MLLSIQRIRNWTTGRLHTSMDDIYHDIEAFTGEPGIMTHQLVNAFTAIKPWLESRLPKDLHPRLWDDAFDPSHTGDDVEIAPMTPEEKAAFWKVYGELSSPLLGSRT